MNEFTVRKTVQRLVSCFDRCSSGEGAEKAKQLKEQEVSQWVTVALGLQSIA